MGLLPPRRWPGHAQRPRGDKLLGKAMGSRSTLKTTKHGAVGAAAQRERVGGSS